MRDSNKINEFFKLEYKMTYQEFMNIKFDEMSNKSKKKKRILRILKNK